MWEDKYDNLIAYSVEKLRKVYFTEKQSSNNRRLYVLSLFIINIPLQYILHILTTINYSCFDNPPISNKDNP